MQERRHATSWAAEEEGTRYERGRPGYPGQAGVVLAERLGLRPGRWVADVGAGTGKLTRVLTSTGAHVVAVEPMAGMRARLREVPGPSVVAGSAEDLPLRDGALQAVTVAQAIHWFRLVEAAGELRRVLVPGGRMAIVNNVRDPDWPARARMAEILARYEALEPRPESVRTWPDELAGSGLFTRVERIELPHEQRFASWEAFDARFESISYVILLGEADRAALRRELRAAVGPVVPVVVPLRTVIEIWAPASADLC